MDKRISEVHELYDSLKITKFHFIAHSDDIYKDSKLTELLTTQTEKEEIEEEVKRIVQFRLSDYLPEVIDFRIDSSGSVDIFFNVIIQSFTIDVGAVSVVTILTHYDTIRRNIIRIKNDVTGLLRHILRRNQIQDNIKIVSACSVDEPARINQNTQSISWPNILISSKLFAITLVYLLVMNLILLILIASIVIHAVFQ
jgi:hypothetical protein